MYAQRRRLTTRERPPSPVFKSLAGYQRSWLSGDLVSGLTVWAVLVPEALAIVTGVCGLVACLIRLGFLASFISEPVLKGSSSASPSRSPRCRSRTSSAYSGPGGDSLEKAWGLIGNLDEAQGWTLVVGTVSLALVSRPANRGRRGHLVYLSLTRTDGVAPGNWIQSVRRRRPTNLRSRGTRWSRAVALWV
jgi:hypothetical protein